MSPREAHSKHPVPNAENFPATEYPAEKFRKLMSINVEG